MLPSKRAARAQTAYLGLGSDLGDRLGHLARALERLDADALVGIEAVSPVYATEPVGLVEAPEFLNAVVRIRTERDPEALLDLCLAIEAGLGRVRAGRPAPRTIDIDLLLYGDVRLDSERLRLPHPRMTERAFVVVPLRDIAPDLVVAGRPVSEWAALGSLAGRRR
jgi:2-amino-4-hydroxy-6-hydroxymethyldihydropteridine diphosphokinase